MKSLLIVSLLFLLSCSPGEIARLAGVGLDPFKSQGKVYSQTFAKDIAYCYQKSWQALRGKMQADIYRYGKDSSFIVAINFHRTFQQCNSSTEAAVFFTKTSQAETKVEVASLNYSLSEFVASNIFEALSEDSGGEESS